VLVDEHLVLQALFLMPKHCACMHLHPNQVTNPNIGKFLYNKSSK
jgi:hypothetical protein